MSSRSGADDDCLERIRVMCLAFPEAEEVLSYHQRPLFRVRRRRFAIFNGESSPPRKRWAGWGRSLHFPTAMDERAALRADGRFRASPHHGDRGWLAIDLDDATDWVELAELVDAAYRQVAPRALVELLKSPG